MVTCEYVAERLKELKQEDLEIVAHVVDLVINAYLPVLDEEEIRELAKAREEYERGEYEDWRSVKKELEALP